MNQIPRLTSPHPVTDDLRAIAAAGEDLLRHSAEQAGEEYRRARAKFEALLGEARQSLAAAEAASLDKARQVTLQADQYVHSHPWQSVGFGAMVAGAVGMLAGLLIGRR